jgi:hypothetical protein
LVAIVIIAISGIGSVISLIATLRTITREHRRLGSGSLSDTPSLPLVSEPEHSERAGEKSTSASEATDRLWRDSPGVASLEEYFRYSSSVQLPLRQKVDSSARVHAERVRAVDNRSMALRGGRPFTTVYRASLLVGLFLFIITAVLAFVFDYPTFRGLYPAGPLLLPITLAILAVLAIIIGSVLLLDVQRHDFIPASANRFVRGAITIAGALLAFGVVAYMTIIAPYRSYNVHSQTTAVVGQVDRLSAATVNFLVIPLTEAAILGGEVLMLGIAVWRAKKAQVAHQRAINELEYADNRFIAQLVDTMATHGHSEEEIRRIQARIVGNGLRAS